MSAPRWFRLVMLVMLAGSIALGAARDAEAQVFKPRGKAGKPAAAARKTTPAPTAVVSKKATRTPSVGPATRRIAAPKAAPARKGRAAKARAARDEDDVTIVDDEDSDDVTIVDDE